MGSPTVDGYTGESAGRAGQVSVRFAALPYRENGGQLRFCHGDFGLELMDALYEALPTPRRFLLGAGSCRQCGTKLREEPRSRSFDLELAMRELEPIKVQLQIPATRCTACGLEHHTGDRQVESDVSDALIEAFSSVGLRP